MSGQLLTLVGHRWFHAVLFNSLIRPDVCGSGAPACPLFQTSHSSLLSISSQESNSQHKWFQGLRQVPRGQQQLSSCPAGYMKNPHLAFTLEASGVLVSRGASVYRANIQDSSVYFPRRVWAPQSLRYNYQGKCVMAPSFPLPQ